MEKNVQPLCLFHKVETGLWMEVRGLLWRLCSSFINGRGFAPGSFFTPADVLLLQRFSNQMEIGYLHPRANGHRFYIAESSTTFLTTCLPVCRKSSKKVPAPPSIEKKPK